MTHLFKNYETTKMARKNRDVVEEVSLNASGEVSLDLDNQDDIRDLIPLRNIQVVNTGNTDLEMYINQQRQGYKVIPSNTLYTRNAQKIKNLKFVNRSSTTATTFSVLLDNDYSLEELKLMELGIEK